MRKIVKIVTFYDDGTFSESVPTQAPITPLPYPLPGTPYQPWVTPNSPPMGGNCPQCGLKLEGVMGYVCSQPKCPTGLGGAWCNVSDGT